MLFLPQSSAMKKNQLLLAAILLIVSGAVYRLVPYPVRPFGFAPQLAIAVFGGAIMKDKKLAFALPLFSMLISDALFEMLFRADIVATPGFYEGQAINYLLIMGMSFIGMAMPKINVKNVAAASLSAPVLFFLLSNFITWAQHGGYSRPMTGEGLFQAYVDGVPFFAGSLSSTVFFSAMFFGVWSLITRQNRATTPAVRKAVA
jgi:hypothetical protein